MSNEPMKYTQQIADQQKEIQTLKESLKFSIKTTLAQQSRIKELEAQLKEKDEVIKYAYDKAYTLYKTKNAVSQQCRRDAEKLFVSLQKALESPKEQPKINP